MTAYRADSCGGIRERGALPRTMPEGSDLRNPNPGDFYIGCLKDFFVLENTACIEVFLRKHSSGIQKSPVPGRESGIFRL